MAVMRVAIQNFTGGEISAWQLSARYDISKYKTALKKVRNFICELHGDLRRRPGTHFCHDLGGAGKLIPFRFSTDAAQNYAMVFQDKKVRFAQGYGLVLNGGAPVEVVTPYLAADLPSLSYAQSGDTVYLAHRAYAFRKLVRTSHTSWALSTVVFVPTIASVTGVTVQHSVNGTYALRYVVCAENAKGEISLMGTPGVDLTAKHPTDWLTGESCAVGWTAVADAVRYLIFRESGGYYGLVGLAEGQATTSFVDVKYEADTSDTPPEAIDWFGSGNNPGLVAFHQQRLVLAAGANEPQFFYSSKVGSYEDWSKSRPAKDDDPIRQAVASGSIDAIQWLASFGTLLLGTGGAEYKAHNSGDAFTSKTLNLSAQSYWGSASLPPLVIGNSVLHLQRQGSHVRDLFYSLERDGYGGNDLSVLAPHLFDNNTLTQWAYQQAPGCIVWATRNDGMLLGMSYLKEHEIWGWHPHTTQGTFESVCSMPGAQEDSVYFIVKRTIGGADKYYLERLATKWNPDDGIAQAMFLDSAKTYSGAATSTVNGLSHLEGMTVDALVDGSPHTGLTVSGGSLSLPVAGSVIHVGLQYTSIAIPMTPEADTQQGTTLGRTRAYGQCVARVVDTVGGQYGPDEDNLFDFASTPENWGQAVPPFTGDLEMTLTGGYDSTASVCIAQSLPLPFTLAALMLDVDLGG